MDVYLSSPLLFHPFSMASLFILDSLGRGYKRSPRKRKKMLSCVFHSFFSSHQEDPPDTIDPWM